MQPKSVGLIAVVAVIVLIVAVFSWYTSEDDDDAYREIDVGDSFLYKATVIEPAHGGIESVYYEHDYVYKSDPDGLMLMTAFSGGNYDPYDIYITLATLEPLRTETIEFMGESIECQVFENQIEPTNTEFYWVDPSTGVYVYSECYDDGLIYEIELIASTVYGGLEMDVAVNSQETEVEVGDTVSYLVKDYDGSRQTGSGMLTYAVTSVEGDVLTYTVSGSGESVTDTVANFLNSDGYRGLEPAGSGYVKNTEYGNIICDLYIEEDSDGTRAETYVGKDDGVVYLRCEYDGDLRTEYSLAYSSLVVGSAPFDLVPMDDPFGYTATGVCYTMDGGVPTDAAEWDWLIAYHNADGSYRTAVYENMDLIGYETGIPDFIALQDVTWAAAEGRTINTPWGALECEGMAGEIDGMTVTAFMYGGVVIAMDVQGDGSSGFVVYTHYGYDWGRDDPIPESNLRTDIVVNDYCSYFDMDGSGVFVVRVVSSDGDGNITVTYGGAEYQWTVDRLTKGPGYTDGEYIGKTVGDFLYGTRYCDTYQSIGDDGTVYTSYIGIDDGILYAFGVEKDGEESLYELYWASYVA